MYKKLIVTALIITTLLVLVPVARAITFGHPDGDGHPNVGAMIVEEPDGVKYLYCSGTLIAPDVFLTAAHCTAAAAAYGANPHDAYVTFDPVWDKKAKLHRGTYYLNPDYGHDSHDLHDVAVIILDRPIREKHIEPATLPPAGLLSQMEKDHELKDQQFVTVGYGTLRDDKTGGPHALDGYGERYFADQTFMSLKPYWLQISMNPSTGSGGTCYGDSGGPHFLGDSNMVVSLTVTGDAWCRATDVTYRLDTDSARSYLSQFVDLP
ncbi:MAG: trypsin-like serine protease [Anaerolineales bacterium]